MDGHGIDVVSFEQNDDYLNLINKTVADYTDILDPRPFPYWLSPQERENQRSIVELIGIDGITEEEMEDGRGMTLLYDLVGGWNSNEVHLGKISYLHLTVIY